MGLETTFTKSLAAAVSNGICTSQSGSASTPLTINGSLASGGVATIDSVAAGNSGALGRRVIIAYTGTDTSFTIVGTNATGNAITDVAVGSGGSAQSNMDFVTVSSITPVGGGLTSLTAGTNGVGSSPWWTTNWRGYAPVNISTLVELVSGSINYTIQHSYDDPNFLLGGLTYPTPINDPVLVNQIGTADGLMANPVKAMRVLINSGTGVIRGRFVQAGVG